MADNDRFDHICQNQCRVFICYLRHYIILRMPETVTSPRVDSSMVTCFFYSIKDIIMLDNMSSPCAFTDINSGTRSIINTVMAYRYITAHGELHASYLLFKQTNSAYQIIINLTISRMIVIPRTFCIIHFIQRNKLTVRKTRWTNSFHIPYKTNCTGSNKSQVRACHWRIAIIFIKKHTISSYIMDIAIMQVAFLRSPENDGSSPVYRPVRTKQGLVMFHKCPYRLR